MQTPSFVLMVIVASGVALSASDTWAPRAIAPSTQQIDVTVSRASVVLRSEQSLLNTQGLAAIDALTKAIVELEGVERVHSPTTLRRPRRLRSGAVAWTTLPRRPPDSPLELSAWRARVLRDPLIVPRALLPNFDLIR